MVIATYPIYFTQSSKGQYNELCERIEGFEDFWDSVIFLVRKDPSHYDATRLSNGLLVKTMPLHSPRGELRIAFTRNEACVVIQGIEFIEDDI